MASAAGEVETWRRRAMGRRGRGVLRSAWDGAEAGQNRLPLCRPAL